MNKEIQNFQFIFTGQQYLLLVYERDSKDLFHSLGPPILILSLVSSQIIFMKINIFCREEKYFLS